METIMTKFRSHTVRFPTASLLRQLTHLDVGQVAAQQHQGSLTEYYDLLLAHEPPPPAEPTNNPALNVSLHRLNRALQAALHSIGGEEVPEEIPPTSEGADASAEFEGIHQPPAPPTSEPQPCQTVSDQLDAESPDIQSPQPHTATDQYSEPEPQAQSSPLGPSLPATNTVSAVSATATSTATSEDSASATTSTTEPPLSSHIEPKPDPDPAPEQGLGPEPKLAPEPEPEPEQEAEPPAPEVDWAEARELEIARLGSENARLRALLGIDPDSLTAAGIPDIDPEPSAIASLFLLHGATQAPVAAGSSAWANGGTEPTNPFTAGFREDPSVLGLAATPSRLHALTPPNAPAATTATTATGALVNRASGVFVSASWGPFAAAAAAAAAGGNGNGNGAGAGAGIGVGLPGQGPMAAQIQQQKPPQPPLGIPGLARQMELQGPGGGPGAGRGRGVLFGGRGRSVGGW